MQSEPFTWSTQRLRITMFASISLFSRCTKWRSWCWPPTVFSKRILPTSNENGRAMWTRRAKDVGWGRMSFNAGMRIARIEEMKLETLRYWGLLVSSSRYSLRVSFMYETEAVAQLDKMLMSCFSETEKSWSARGNLPSGRRWTNSSRKHWGRRSEYPGITLRNTEVEKGHLDHAVPQVCSFLSCILG